VNHSRRSLLVVPVMPAEGGNGLAMRAGLLLEGLARAGDVDLLVAPVFGDPGPASPLASRLAANVDALSREAPAGAGVVARKAATAGLVLVMRLYLAPLLDELLDSGERPTLAIDVDDVESATRRELGHTGEAERFAQLEAHYLPLVDWTLACSRPDADQLTDLGAKRVDVVPNAVRPPAQIAPAPRAGTGSDLIFVGNLSHAPNVEAAAWLVAEVLPLLPDVTVALVGSAPDPAVRRLEGGGVTVAADVPDVGPHYANSRMAVVPIRAGGGSRIKVLEAYAHGRPVGATTAGVRGTELGDGHGPALVADDAAGFASVCRRILGDPELAAELGRRGVAAVAADGSVDVVADRIANAAAAAFAPVNSPAERPLNRLDVEVAEADDGFVVYDHRSDRVHYLNHTAVLVLELCNGENSAGDIVGLIQRAYDLADPPEKEVRECLARLETEGLVD